MGRGLIILLVASLTFNVFAGGFFAGRLFNNAPAPSQERSDLSQGMDNPFSLMRNAEALPTESRQVFREAFREQLPDLRQRHREIRRLRFELGVLLQTEDWDRDTVEAKLLEIEAAKARQGQAFNDVFLTAFGSLSAEDRRLIIAEAGKGKDRRPRGLDGPNERRERRPPPPPE